MPELPEVETIKLQLASVLLNHTIKSIEVRFGRIISGDANLLIGKKIINLRRLGKMLLIDLSGGWSLAVHLKMTGRLVYKKVRPAFAEASAGKEVREAEKSDINYDKDKHTHVVVNFTSGDRLFYHDQRKFGWLRVIKTKEINELPYVAGLGPEFLSSLTVKHFNNILKNSRQPIKQVLMDQKKLSGSGNIYANEALWCAKIDPRTKANTLSDGSIASLFHCFETILRQAIKWQGASSRNYRDAFGQKGTVQKHFEVYEREGAKCRRCGTAIKKIKLGGRGTYFCPACQR